MVCIFVGPFRILITSDGVQANRLVRVNQIICAEITLSEGTQCDNYNSLLRVRIAERNNADFCYTDRLISDFQRIDGGWIGSFQIEQLQNGLNQRIFSFIVELGNQFFQGEVCFVMHTSEPRSKSAFLSLFKLVEFHKLNPNINCQCSYEKHLTWQMYTHLRLKVQASVPADQFEHWWHPFELKLADENVCWDYFKDNPKLLYQVFGKPVNDLHKNRSHLNAVKILGIHIYPPRSRILEQLIQCPYRNVFILSYPRAQGFAVEAHWLNQKHELESECFPNIALMFNYFENHGYTRLIDKVGRLRRFDGLFNPYETLNATDNLSVAEADNSEEDVVQTFADLG